MIRINIIILLSFFMLKCSNKDDDTDSNIVEDGKVYKFTEDL